MDGPISRDGEASAPGIRFELAPLPDRDVGFFERLSEYPRGPDILGEVLRAVGRTACVGLMRLQYRITVEGKLPEVPRLALAANHQSHLDALTVLAALPANRRRELAVLAARDYFFSRAARGAAAGVFAAAVPFDRTRATELRSWARRLRELPRGTILLASLSPPDDNHR
jgi:1-acyl-sn-glycerol-3-phosphate acyltransferase